MKNVKLYLVTCIFLGVLLYAQAKPMDAGEAEKLPDIEEILVSVCSSGRLDSSERKDIESYLSSSNGVIVSLGAWITAQSKDCETELCSVAESNAKIADLMAQAFIRLLLIKKKTSTVDSDKTVSSLELCLKDHNPYLRIEAAKEIYRIDARKGMQFIRTLLADKSIIARGEAFRQLDMLGQAGDAEPVPMPDEEYELLLSIIEKYHQRIGRCNENGKIVPKVSQPGQSKATADRKHEEVVLPCYCEHHVHQEPSSVTNLLCAVDLESYFKEVCISSSNVVMRFHDQGMRYIMINDEESKVSRYGESICLSTNQSMRIESRGRSLELKGYSNEKDAGFVVTSKTDLRSFGGGLKVKKARWIISSKKLEIDNDKGLFVVSSSEDYTRETGCDSVRSDLR